MDNMSKRNRRIWTASILALVLLMACTLPVSAQDRATTRDGLYVTDDGAYGVYVIANNPGAVGIAECYLDTLPADFIVPTNVALDGKQIPVGEITYEAFGDHPELQIPDSMGRPSFADGSYPEYLPVPVEVAPMQQATLEGINAIRADVGAAPLELNTWLNQAAMVRATEMALANTMDHLRPDGRTCDTVITGFGNVSGENVIMPTVFPTAEEADRVAQVSVGMWHESQGHYENLIKTVFTQTGVGYAQSPTTGTWYGCQIFSNGGGQAPTIDYVRQNPPYYAPESSPAPTPSPTVQPTPKPTQKPFSAVPSELSGFAMDSVLTWLGKRDDNVYLAASHLTESGTSSTQSVDGFLRAMHVPQNFSAKIFTGDGTPCDAKDAVATGYTISISKDGKQLPDPVVCVIKGDVTGNGQAGLSDLVQMAGAFSGSRELTDPYLLAADLNGDGNVTVTDLVQEAILMRG